MEKELRTRRDLMAIIQLLVGATMISFSPVFVELANVGPTAAGFYRNLFGGVFLLIIVVVRGDSLWKGLRPFGLALTCAALFAADLTFWHRSIEYIGPGLSTIMGNMQIFFLAAFGLIVFRERLDWKFLISLPLAIVGLLRRSPTPRTFSSFKNPNRILSGCPRRRILL